MEFVAVKLISTSRLQGKHGKEYFVEFTQILVAQQELLKCLKKGYLTDAKVETKFEVLTRMLESRLQNITGKFPIADLQSKKCVLNLLIKL